MKKRPICPYCHEESSLVDSAIIYSGKSFGWAYVCWNFPQCDSYVGCHPGTKKPLGRLSNKELRESKKGVHAAFDPLWQAKMRLTGCSKKEARQAAYVWLAGQLGIAVKNCHIGMFDLDTCRRALAILTVLREEAEARV